MKKILHIVFWSVLPLAMLVMLGFVSASQSEMLCSDLNIEIDYSNGMHFVRNEHVVEKLKQSRIYPVGTKFSTVNIGKMEKVLMDIPEVENANVYRTVDGKMGISITQRTPIVRVRNINGRNFYIDNRGYQMPLSSNYFPRVIIVNGYISEPFIEESAFEIARDSANRAAFKTDDIYAMAKFISGDPFWNAQIQEIYFTRDGDMELIPVVGDHRIVFGDTTYMEEKFNKLKVFYQDGLKKTGWNQYDTLNLKYKNQIVCSKK